MAIRLVVGLGNPGKEYERTRHNAGFWLVERFASANGITLRKDAKFKALVGKTADGAWLLLPQSFMNLSGQPVQMLAGFFRIKPEEVLVVHDELDFPPGTARLKQGGKCAYCHEPIARADATGDHVKPRFKGGATTRENIKAACEPCNLTKRSMSEAAFLRAIKNPQPGDSLHIWMAWSRRRIWLATERVCTRITRMVE